MRYDRIYKAKFIERPNRFIAYAELNGKKETVHVKNTGRCAELLRPGADIYIQESDNPSRKTRWDLIAVKKGSRMINMDSQIPNKVVKEWIEQGNLFENVTLIRPETVYKNSRFDLYVEAEDQNGGIRKIFIEIKGVTLEENGVCRFPDAPSERAVKHLEELSDAKKNGYEAYVFFVIQMKGVRYFTPRDVLFRLTNAYDYFADIWERAIHAKGKQYIYEMSLEDHYLHSVCHLAEHFVRGGIGIRMVLDIYILSETPRMDKAYVQRQLKALKLQKFEENIRSLAQLWFSDDEKTVRTEVSDELENYALSGGIFGSRETARRNGTVLYESKNKFVKQLVFPSYEVMKTSCPWLKTPILLPAAWLVRYKRALTASRGNIGYHIERAKTFDRVEDQEQKERCQFFERCGLEDVSENF